MILANNNCLHHTSILPKLSDIHDQLLPISLVAPTVSTPFLRAAAFALRGQRHFSLEKAVPL